MQPLFRAVMHGCAVGVYQQVLDEVYLPRIQRHDHDNFYLSKKLAAFSDDLTVISNLFSSPWIKPVEGLRTTLQAAVRNWAGYNLRALGRFDDAAQLFESSLGILVAEKDWRQASVQAGNMSELQLSFGNIEKAINQGEASIIYADKSGNDFQRMSKRSTCAEALHQFGCAKKALILYRESEEIQKERQPDFPCLYSVQGFRYRSLLLEKESTSLESLIEETSFVIEIAKHYDWLLAVGLDELILGQAHFLKGAYEVANQWLNNAVSSLRKYGSQQHLPRGLIASGKLQRTTKKFIFAQQDLQETYELAEPSGMRLHLTDYHLEMARLILAVEADPTQYPEASSDREQRILPFADQEEPGILTLQGHIVEADKLINETGYHRRDAELAELKQQAGMS